MRPLALVILEYCAFGLVALLVGLVLTPRFAFAILLILFSIASPIYAYWYYAHVWPHRNSCIPCEVPWTPVGSLFQLGILPSFGIHKIFGWKGDYSFYGGHTLCEGLHLAHARFGDVYAVWLGFDRVVMLNTPTAAKFIYSQTRATFDQAEYLRDRQRGIANASLSTTVGAAHYRHVKALGPMLKKFKLIPFIPRITEKVVHLLDRWYNFQVTHPNNLFMGHMQMDYKALMLDIFGTLAFDHDLDLLKCSHSGLDGDNKLPELARAILVVIERVANKFLLGVPGKVAIAMESIDPGLTEARAIIRSYQLQAIEKARTKKLSQASKNEGEVDENTADASCANLLELLLSTVDSPNPLLSIEEFFDDLTLFLFAGTDSSSSMLGFATFFLSKNPHIQQRVQKEIWSQLGKPDASTSSNRSWQTMSSPTADQLALMPFLDAVVKETLRLSSTSLGASRQAYIPANIDGFHIAVGENLLVNAVQIQHDDRFYPVASSFRPQRWLSPDDCTPEDLADESRAQMAMGGSSGTTGSSTVVLHTFGGGHRICVGMELAKLELKTILALLLRHCTFEDFGQGNTNTINKENKVDQEMLAIQIAIPDVRHLQVKVLFQ